MRSCHPPDLLRFARATGLVLLCGLSSACDASSGPPPTAPANNDSERIRALEHRAHAAAESRRRELQQLEAFAAHAERLQRRLSQSGVSPERDTWVLSDDELRELLGGSSSAFPGAKLTVGLERPGGELAAELSVHVAALPEASPRTVAFDAALRSSSGQALFAWADERLMEADVLPLTALRPELASWARRLLGPGEGLAERAVWCTLADLRAEYAYDMTATPLWENEGRLQSIWITAFDLAGADATTTASTDAAPPLTVADDRALTLRDFARPLVVDYREWVVRVRPRSVRAFSAGSGSDMAHSEATMMLALCHEAVHVHDVRAHRHLDPTDPGMTPTRRSEVNEILEGHADFVTARVAHQLGALDVWQRLGRARRRRAWSPTGAEGSRGDVYERGIRRLERAHELSGADGVRELLRAPPFIESERRDEPR